MKEVRIEVNLDVRDYIDIEDLIKRIRYGVNVFGVEKVQAIRLTKGPKPKEEGGER